MQERHALQLDVHVIQALGREGAAMHKAAGDCPHRPTLAAAAGPRLPCHTSMKTSPTILAVMSTSMMGKPYVTLLVASIMMTVRLSVILTIPPAQGRGRARLGGWGTSP